MGQTGSPVVEAGVRFLVESMRDDGSWPIDTNLATWVTTLSIGALAEARCAAAARYRGDAGVAARSAEHARASVHARGAGRVGVDAVERRSARRGRHVRGTPRLGDLGDPDPRLVAAAAAGVRWLLGIQNRDGGIPTFCRGWGTLPFDRSTPEITAHALQAWSLWWPHFDRVAAAGRASGGWASRQVPGRHPNDQTAHGSRSGSATSTRRAKTIPRTERLVSFSACTRLWLAQIRGPRIVAVSRCAWLLEAQNADGGWGGSRAVPPSIEETGVVLAALVVPSRMATRSRSRTPSRAAHGG